MPATFRRVRADLTLAVEESDRGNGSVRARGDLERALRREAGALAREIQVIVGRSTTSMRTPRKREFGIGLTPSVAMFFVSWKSDAKIRMNSGPALSGLASRGIGKDGNAGLRSRTRWR